MELTLTATRIIMTELTSIRFSGCWPNPSEIIKHDRSLLEGTALAPHQKEGGVANIAPMPRNFGWWCWSWSFHSPSLHRQKTDNRHALTFSSFYPACSHHSLSAHTKHKQQHSTQNSCKFFEFLSCKTVLVIHLLELKCWRGRHGWDNTSGAVSQPLVTLSLTINETLKWLALLPILMQESFSWWQCSDRYIASLLHHLHTPFPCFLPIPNKPYGFCRC